MGKSKIGKAVCLGSLHGCMYTKLRNHGIHRKKWAGRSLLPYTLSFPPWQSSKSNSAIDMAKLRRCPTCKVVFPTIDALNDHYRKTSHKPLPFKCESCERAFKNSYGLQDVGIQLSVLIDLSISWAHILWSISNRNIHMRHRQVLFTNVNLAIGYLRFYPAYKM